MRRFWDLVERGDPAACWRWRGGRDARGRPFFSSIGGLGILACRFAYELAVGPLERGDVVLQSCGAQDCVNPSHLRRTSRSATEARSGRYRRGSHSRAAKLTESAVREIRRKAVRGESPAALAADHGVSQSTISRIVRRHAQPPAGAARRPPEAPRP